MAYKITIFSSAMKPSARVLLLRGARFRMIEAPFNWRMATILAVSALLQACRSTAAPRPKIQYDTIRITKSDTLFQTRIDTVRVTWAATAPPTPDITALIAARDDALADLKNARSSDNAARGRLANAEHQLGFAVTREKILNAMPRDSARVDGYHEVTEGRPYPFRLTIAKHTTLPPVRLNAGEIIGIFEVPRIQDSVKACLAGTGFKIALADGTPANCQVRKFAQTARREWLWTVVADSVGHNERDGQVQRQLVFSIDSYSNDEEDDPQLNYPVTVLVHPKRLSEQVIDWLGTAKGIVTSIAALVAAVTALFSALQIGKRKGAQEAANSVSAPTH